MEKGELLKAIAVATKQFVSDSNELLALAKKAKAGVMQTQISSEDLVQYYKDAILDCLKKSNQLINDISKKYFNNDYKATLSALSKVNSKDVNESLIKNIVNLITNLEKNKTRKAVVLNALKNIGNLYLKSPADMSGLKRSIVDLDKISKMKNESHYSGKTLLEQAKEILFGKTIK
jgi:hypothetical protein